MASDKGFPSKDREVDRLVSEDHVTSQPVREKQVAKDVISHLAIVSQGTDTVEASSSLYSINATAHDAKVGDVIKFTSGNLQDQEVKVIKTETDSFELGELLSEIPAPGDTFEIFRHTYLQASASGSLNVNAVQTPVKFIRNGVEVEVTEDTAFPSGNLPLPVKLTDLTGDVTITAGDLNVALSHQGVNPDSVIIGDGVQILNITASGEAEAFDSTTHGKLDSLLTELEAKADLTETQPVSAASLPLPTGASTEATLAALSAKVTACDTTGKATEAKQDDAITQLTSIAGEDFATQTTLASLEAKDFATQTTLAALLVELQAKADLSETQPVSAASLPLPSGASTESKQDDAITQLTSIAGEDFATQTTLAALLTELQAKADLTETQPVSLASQPLPTGAATEATLVTIDQDTNAIKQRTRLEHQSSLNFRNDYTVTPVTTAADLSISADIGGTTIRGMEIFDSSGETLEFKVNGSHEFYIFPGGNGKVDVRIPSNAAISVRAVSATASVGELTINFYRDSIS